MGDELRRKRDNQRRACRARFSLLWAVCECGYALATERHHWDGNPANNRRSNVLFLCEPCHDRWHSGERWHADRDPARWHREGGAVATSS